MTHSYPRVHVASRPLKKRSFPQKDQKPSPGPGPINVCLAIFFRKVAVFVGSSRELACKAMDNRQRFVASASAFFLLFLDEEDDQDDETGNVLEVA